MTMGVKGPFSLASFVSMKALHAHCMDKSNSSHRRYQIIEMSDTLSLEARDWIALEYFLLCSALHLNYKLSRKVLYYY